MESPFIFSNNQNQIFLQKNQKLFDHINKYIKFYKRYPNRKYLASYINLSESELLKHLDYLVEKNKMAKKDGNYYIPEIETKEAAEKEEVTIKKDIPETIKDDSKVEVQKPAENVP